MALRLRRGTDLERQSVIFAEGELVYTTDTKSLYVGDGQTLGGILISGDINESPASLTRNLDLNSYDITGSGDIDISGVVTATQFVGDGSGLTNLNLLDVVDGGFYSINIIGADSSVIVNRDTNTVTGNLVGDVIGSLKGDVIGPDSSIIINSTTNEIYGNFIGDGSQLNNVILTDGSSHKINVVGLDSSLIINSFTGEVNASALNTSEIVTNNTGLLISNNQENARSTVKVSSINERSVLKLIRAANEPISSFDYMYGSIFFGRNDTSGELATSIIIGYKDKIILGTDETGSFANSESFICIKNGNLGVNTFDPSEKLDIQGNAIISGNIKSSSFIQFGSFSKIERDALTANNGMVIYNTTINKFQGYQNNAWINLDTGTPDP